MYYPSSLKKKRRFTAMLHLKKNVIESLAETFLPEIRAFFESEYAFAALGVGFALGKLAKELTTEYGKTAWRSSSNAEPA